ncbi:hypothetical protein RQP46_007604 [Phenoliferia psychrophenolica]
MVKHNARSNAFNDIFGRAPAPTNQSPSSSPSPQPQLQQGQSPYPSALGPGQQGPGLGRRPTTNPGYGPMGHQPLPGEMMMMNGAGAGAGGGRPASGGGGPQHRATSYHDPSPYHQPPYQQQQTQLQDPYGGYMGGQAGVGAGGGGGQGRASSVYAASPSPSLDYPLGPGPPPGQWQGSPQQQGQGQGQGQPLRHSPSYNNHDVPLDYGHPAGPSPRQPQSHPAGPGPQPYPHHHPRPPSSGSTHLPYSSASSSSSQSYPSSSATSVSSSAAALPPSLPEFAIVDDFFGFESERAPNPNQRNDRDSLDSSWSGASQATQPSPRSSYGQSQLEGFEEYYDSPNTRRNSNDSDYAASTQSSYRGGPPPHDRPLLALNPSLVSLPAHAQAYAQQQQGLPPQHYSPQPPYHQLLPRRSSESVRVLPTQPKHSSTGADQQRSFSFTGLDRPPPSSFMPSLPPSLPSSTSTATSSAANALIPRRSPVVYPALLSRVAEAFKTRITLSERVKDGLVYQETFDGRDAVDKIAYIIKTTDRNLALLLGRALDAQKFFHDVTYDHRLRDSPAELYQFKERLASPFLEDEGATGEGSTPTPTAGGATPNDDENRPLIPGAAPTGQARRMSDADTVASEESSFPSGVFTLLTDCYSPTCTRDRLCYSIACPRRLEQQARLNLKPKPGFLTRSLSSESLGDDFKEPGSLWIHSVPQEIADSTPDSEKKRQECLNEVFYTERDFVRDMEYLRDSWIKPLRSGNIIPEERREDFVTQVFWNVLEIYAVNVRLADLLNKRQKHAHVVDKIGDIFLDLVPHFGPFVKYGAHQLYGKYEFEKEKAANPAFAKFVDETERKPESRKLELNGYLTKPTTRLARYPLLLEACLKHTADDNPDKVILPKVVKLVREFLAKVNVETGKSENRFNLAQLDQQLVFKNGEAVDLRLRDEEREMIYKGPLKKRGGTQSESAELTVYLFDHAILMVKQKSKNEQSKVYRKPIPLELLVVAPLDDSAAARGGAVRPKSLISRGSNPKYPANPPPGVDKHSKNGFAMTFIHLGRRGYQITLWSSSWAGRKKWLEKIEGRQLELRDRSLVFETRALSAGYFVGTNRVTCAAPFDNGNRMVYGTDNGVYLSDLRDNAKVPVKVISVPNVTQLDVLEEQGILIVLADKAVQTFFVDNLDPGDAVGAAKRARKISSHATFFKAGQCLNRTLVCVVKSGSVSSTIKTLEPITHDRNKKQAPLRKFLQGSNEALRVFKEFYIPTESSSVHFLKSKLCVGCTKGFEIVDLETLDTQGLLDPADSSLDFVQKRESARPIAIYRVDGDFLLCYDEFAFYVNKNGWRAKSNWIIQWEGMPTTFALHYPYVLAFEPTFVEVRHVESGALMQIIPGNSLRCLFADTPPSASSSAAHQQGSYFPQQYGGGYGHSPRFPPPGSARTEIIIADADRVFSPKPGKKLQQCNGCKIAVYCDRTCQKAAWKEHKVACRADSEVPQRHLGYTRSNISTWFTPGCKPEILTERLVLRSITFDDEAGIFAVKREPVVSVAQMSLVPHDIAYVHTNISPDYILASIPAIPATNPRTFIRERWMFGIEPRLGEDGERLVQPVVEGSKAKHRLAPDGYIGNIGLRIEQEDGGDPFDRATGVYDTRKLDAILMLQPGTEFKYPSKAQVKRASVIGDIFFEIHPDYWNQKVMTEAIQGVLTFAFETLNLPSVSISPFFDNARAISIARHLGGVRAGVALGAPIASGELSLFHLATPAFNATKMQCHQCNAEAKSGEKLQQCKACKIAFYCNSDTLGTKGNISTWFTAGCKVEILTERLMLRSITFDDEGGIFAVKRETVVGIAQMAPAPKSLAQVQTDTSPDYILASIPAIPATIRNPRTFIRQRWMFAIEPRLDGDGQRTEFKYPTKAQVKTASVIGDIFFELHPDYWNQKVMTEAIEGVLTFAFETLNLLSVSISPYFDNTRAIGIAKHLGGQYEGRIEIPMPMMPHVEAYRISPKASEPGAKAVKEQSKRCCRW